MPKIAKYLSQLNSGFYKDIIYKEMRKQRVNESFKGMLCNIYRKWSRNRVAGRPRGAVFKYKYRQDGGL